MPKTKPKPKTLKWQGLKLTLPAEPPETLLFDLVSIETDGENPLIALRVLRSFLGADQFGEVRNALAVDDSIHADDVGVLIDAIFDVYGPAPEK